MDRKIESELQFKILQLSFIPAVVFFVFCLIDIQSPGLYFDEILFDNYALKWIGNTSQCHTYPDNILALSKGLTMPILGASYCGILSGILSLPFYLLFGFSIFSIRIAHGFWGMMIIFFLSLHLLSSFRRKLKPDIAKTGLRLSLIFMTLLLSINPGIIWAYRTQVQNDMIPVLFFIIAIFFLNRDFEKRSWRYFSGFSLGVACYGYFLYFILSAPIFLVILYKLRKKIYDFFLFALSFLIGVFPYFYGLISMAICKHSIKAIFANDIYKFGNILSVSEKFFLGRMALYKTITNIGLIEMTLEGAPPFSKNQFFVFLGLVMFFLSFVCYDLYKKTFRLSIIETVGFIIAPITLFLSVFRLTPGMNTHHLYVGLILLYFGVLLYIIRFMSQYFSFSLNGKNRIYRSLLSILVCCFFLFVGTINLIQLGLMHKQLRQTGGFAYFSDSTHRTVEFLRSRYSNSKIFFAGWGLWVQASFLTNGKMNYDLNFEYDYIKKELQSGGKTVIVWSYRAPEEEIRKVIEILRKEFVNHSYSFEDNGLNIDVVEFNQLNR